MWVTSSLSNRIFLACTLLATLSFGVAFSFVNANATKEAEADLRRALQESATLADQQRLTTLTDTLSRMARLVADLPKLKAAVETGDVPTVQPQVDGYRTVMQADLLRLYDRNGHLLGHVGADDAALPDVAGPQSTAEYSLFVPNRRGPLQIVSVPILIGTRGVEILGRLTTGIFLDDQRALWFKRVINSDIAFLSGDDAISSSLPLTPDDLRPALRTGSITPVTIGGVEYLALARPMQSDSASHVPQDPPAMLVVLRARAEQLRFLNTLQAGLAGALLVAVVLATIVSYAVARTITRPLAAVTGAMADVAATGDLSRRVPVRSRAWDDEDARLLATAFNALTESIARSRREETQKERLSSLGRLSTVVAHEIRNPLMIISASLRTLRREQVTPAELHEAVADIDEETARLNRIVTEVLDFAKPLRFELGDAALNDICRASAIAATAGDAEVGVAFDLDPDIPAMVTDGERLRTALVNILSNARAAVQAARATPSAGPTGGPGPATATAAAGITVATRVHGGRVTVSVRDSGIGIAPEDLAHIFDPYFTTRRAGTGLGLPIAKNIIEGLGGTISAVSRVGAGTEIRLDLPLIAPENPA